SPVAHPGVSLPLALPGGGAGAVRAEHALPEGAHARSADGVLQARLGARGRSVTQPVNARPAGEARDGSDGGALLTVRGLTKPSPLYQPWRLGLARRQVGVVAAVEDVSFTVARGETLGLVGESGCGKTTTARLILRALRPTRGEIVFDLGDRPVRVDQLEGRPLRALRRHIQLTFQDT